MSVPVRKGQWWYHGRTEEGSQYAIHARRKDSEGSPGGTEEILLDENELVTHSPYLGVGDLAMSHDHSLMAYTVDFDGNEKYELRVLDLASRTDLQDVIADVSYGVVWAADDKIIFYVLTDDAQRPFKVMRHRLGTDSAHDVIVFEEPDERFSVGLGATRSERFIVIGAESTSTSELHLLGEQRPVGTADGRRAP